MGCRAMILPNIRPGRPVDDTDFSDLTAVAQTGPAFWHPTEPDALVIPTDSDVPPNEALAIRRRLVTRDAEEEAHLYALLTARDDTTTPTWAKPLIASELARYGE